MYKLLIALFISISFVSLSQNTDGLEIVIEPNVENRIYVNERIEFKTYIVNNGSERLIIPEPSKMSSLSKSFVAQDFTLFLPNGEEVDVFRCATGGASSRIVSLPGRGVSPNKRTRIGSYHREFKEAGKYKLEVIYVLNGANKPSNLTIDYGNCNLKKVYEFEVFDRSGIAFESKAIGWDEYKTKPKIRSLEKANDSTYIYNLVVKEATNESLRLTAKYKNLRGLTIYAAGMESLPEELLALDLFELTIMSRDGNKGLGMDLSNVDQFKNLRTILFNTNNNIVLPKDLSQLKELTSLRLNSFTNTIDLPKLPKESLETLGVSSLPGLNGLNGDFTEYPKFRTLNIEGLKNYILPTEIKGKITTVSFSGTPHSTMPDMSTLKLGKLNFTSFTGESLPDGFTDCIRAKGAWVWFPKELVKCKEYKVLTKAGHRVLPNK
jgi:hypothetical protein